MRKPPALVRLPRPRLPPGRSVAQALKRRATIRGIRPKALPLQVLSNVLWAACGVNRRKGPFGLPGRTAASASNSQEIDVYVAVREGTYLYEPLRHQLVGVATEDLRTMGISWGQRSVSADVPVQLIYVVDIDRLVHTSGFQEPGLQDPLVQRAYYYVDTGLIAGNVYLFAASQGLAAWFHNCDRPGLEKKLALRPDQRVLFAQSVGYPLPAKEQRPFRRVQRRWIPGLSK